MRPSVTRAGQRRPAASWPCSEQASSPSLGRRQPAGREACRPSTHCTCHGVELVQAWCRALTGVDGRRPCAVLASDGKHTHQTRIRGLAACDRGAVEGRSWSRAAAPSLSPAVRHAGSGPLLRASVESRPPLSESRPPLSESRPPCPSPGRCRCSATRAVTEAPCHGCPTQPHTPPRGRDVTTYPLRLFSASLVRSRGRPCSFLRESTACLL